MNENGRREPDERLADWIDGRMSERERERFAAELRVSALLRQDLADYERTVAEVRAALRAPTAPVRLADRVLASLAGRDDRHGKQVPEPTIRRGGRSWSMLAWSAMSAAALLALALWIDSWSSAPAEKLQLAAGMPAEIAPGDAGVRGAAGDGQQQPPDRGGIDTGAIDTKERASLEKLDRAAGQSPEAPSEANEVASRSGGTGSVPGPESPGGESPPKPGLGKSPSDDPLAATRPDAAAKAALPLSDLHKDTETPSSPPPTAPAGGGTGAANSRHDAGSEDPQPGARLGGRGKPDGSVEPSSGARPPVPAPTFGLPATEGLAGLGGPSAAGPGGPASGGGGGGATQPRAQEGEPSGPGSKGAEQRGGEGGRQLDARQSAGKAAGGADEWPLLLLEGVAPAAVEVRRRAEVLEPTRGEGKDKARSASRGVGSAKGVLNDVELEAAMDAFLATVATTGESSVQWQSAHGSLQLRTIEATSLLARTSATGAARDDAAVTERVWLVVGDAADVGLLLQRLGAHAQAVRWQMSSGELDETQRKQATSLWNEAAAAKLAPATGTPPIASVPGTAAPRRQVVLRFRLRAR